MIVGIAGYKRVGKDTAGAALVEHLGFHRYALADPLREACAALFGWSHEAYSDDHKDQIDSFWGISPRQALQSVGTELIRERLTEIFPGLGNVHIERMRREYLKHGGRMVVTDVRFPDEAQAIHDLGGYIIRIDRPGYHGGDHASERFIDRIDYDHRIDNDSDIPALHDAVIAIAISHSPA